MWDSFAPAVQSVLVVLSSVAGIAVAAFVVTSLAGAITRSDVER